MRRTALALAAAGIVIGDVLGTAPIREGQSALSSDAAVPPLASIRQPSNLPAVPPAPVHLITGTGLIEPLVPAPVSGPHG